MEGTKIIARSKSINTSGLRTKLNPRMRQCSRPSTSEEKAMMGPRMKIVSCRWRQLRSSTRISRLMIGISPREKSSSTNPSLVKSWSTQNTWLSTKLSTIFCTFLIKRCPKCPMISSFAIVSSKKWSSELKIIMRVKKLILETLESPKALKWTMPTH